MKGYFLFLFLDALFFLGYGLALLLRAVRRIFSRHTKA